MSTFFTSDTHYYHANIIRYSQRPWMRLSDFTIKGEWLNHAVKRQRAIEMTDDMVGRHNKIVTPDDDVYHNGDFIFGTYEEAINILRKLNFKNFYFIWGNHDKPMMQAKMVLERQGDELLKRVHFLGDMAEIEVNGQFIVLCHYAMKVWNKSHRGSWHLYGHSHGSLGDDPHSLSFDVGVDCHDYKPLSFEQVKDIMSKKFYEPLDHHKPRPTEGTGYGLDKNEYAKAERLRMYRQLEKEFKRGGFKK